MTRPDQVPQPGVSTTTINPVRDALKLSLVQQVAALVLSGMTLDGGSLLLIVISAVATYWVGAAMILRPRTRLISKLDIILLKWGFFPLCIISFFLCRRAWVLRGYHGG